MHWFTGSTADAKELLSLGVYFSVNSAMREELLRMLPHDRVLPETDYPTARNRTGRRPGDTAGVEQLLADIQRVGATDVRRRFYHNLHASRLPRVRWTASHSESLKCYYWPDEQDRTAHR